MNLLAWLFCVLSTVPVTSETWPSFRGDGSGISPARELPVRWTPSEGVAWREEIPGYGQSSPVIWRDRLFVTSIQGPEMERCLVHCFSLADGRKLWTGEAPASQPHENYFRNSRAAPTCVVDGERVVAFFAGGDVVAYDHDGKRLWIRSLVKDHGPFHSDRGVASSLAQAPEAVFALVDHEGPSYLAALAKSDGRLLWKKGRGERGAAWTSPLVVTRRGKTMVIVSSAGTVEAYDAASGDVLWKRDGLFGNRIPSASIVGDDLFVGAAQSLHSPGDLGAIRRSNCRMRLIDRDGRPGWEPVWSSTRATAYYSTPLAYGGIVHYVTQSGILFGLDRETGKQRYTHRIRDASWASAIGGAGHAYLFLKDGHVLVIRPGSTFEEVALNRLWDEGDEPATREPPLPTEAQKNRKWEGFDATIRRMEIGQQHRIFSYQDPVVYGAAAVERHLVVRTGQHLFCVRGGETDSESPTGAFRRGRTGSSR